MSNPIATIALKQLDEKGNEVVMTQPNGSDTNTVEIDEINSDIPATDEIGGKKKANCCCVACCDGYTKDNGCFLYFLCKYICEPIGVCLQNIGECADACITMCCDCNDCYDAGSGNAGNDDRGGDGWGDNGGGDDNYWVGSDNVEEQNGGGCGGGDGGGDTGGDGGGGCDGGGDTGGDGGGGCDGGGCDD